MYSVRAETIVDRLELCDWRGNRLCFLRTLRRTPRALEAAWGREGCVLELRKEEKFRYDVVGRGKM